MPLEGAQRKLSVLVLLPHDLGKGVEQDGVLGQRELAVLVHVCLVKIVRRVRVWDGGVDDGSELIERHRDIFVGVVFFESHDDLLLGDVHELPRLLVDGVDLAADERDELLGRQEAVLVCIMLVELNNRLLGRQVSAYLLLLFLLLQLLLMLHQRLVVGPPVHKLPECQLIVLVLVPEDDNCLQVLLAVSLGSEVGQYLVHLKLLVAILVRLVESILRDDSIPVA
mmetsp:Transcript_17830/g.41179  ORF Transcript_17830/g.41179 Transcript_17830/m.41179 type:complete len:225 (-) Transcript_17830:354-1028(-)